jgi:hypothetical protein
LATSSGSRAARTRSPRLRRRITRKRTARRRQKALREGRDVRGGGRLVVDRFVVCGLVLGRLSVGRLVVSGLVLGRLLLARVALVTEEVAQSVPEVVDVTAEERLNLLVDGGDVVRDLLGEVRRRAALASRGGRVLVSVLGGVRGVLRSVRRRADIARRAGGLVVLRVRLVRVGLVRVVAVGLSVVRVGVAGVVRRVPVRFVGCFVCRCVAGGRSASRCGTADKDGRRDDQREPG